MSKAVKMKQLSFDIGKANLNFDMLQQSNSNISADWSLNFAKIAVKRRLCLRSSATGCYGNRKGGRSLGVAKIAVKHEYIVAVVDFLTGGIYFRKRPLTSISGGIDAPFSADSWHGDKTGGRSLGVAKIAVKLEDFVLAVEFLTCGSQRGLISVFCDWCINPPETVVKSLFLMQIPPETAYQKVHS